MALVVGLMTYGYIPSKALITNGHIKFTGMYGFILPVSEVKALNCRTPFQPLKAHQRLQLRSR